ncbi:hypothetical protein BGZ58_005756, partial [Dissophora ornata]
MLLLELELNGNDEKQALYRCCREEGPGPHPLKVKRSTDFTKDHMTIPLTSKSSSQDGLRPVWDPACHATPKGILLKAVQDRDRRNANMDNLPAQITGVKQVIQSGFEQQLPPQSSPKDIWSALKAYYKPYLVILRVSGAKLDLETCFVNLAIVEAPAQREKEKQNLKEQAAIFHRVWSIDAVERTNMKSSIPLEQLFEKRTLRDGSENVPKRILVQGRAGIGKTTLCKKLVH